MWSKLIAVKRRREERLRIAIHQVEMQMSELKTARAKLDEQRLKVMQQWQALSAQTSVRRPNGIEELLQELSHYNLTATNFEQESRQLDEKIEGLQQQLKEHNTLLRQCIAKQEKLKLIEKQPR
ncbi:MAG: hypothetical protein ON057_000649 [Glomeribacter sp. 1016415]|uniref:Hydrolase n=1 Tax=Mycoavidus cysteinexigens TaxID=1553431 RepID=A0A2Z6ESH5_9BURK|nr:hypothetical protein [Mycoavidus cysteinexigens]MCX8565922.1 hypothetical protein [Glomeribacter sp. 1016415]BBE08351.1 Putative hydrolase [Mycoavidus cysteinexigens]GAM52946.1 hypothetical protein EBME_1409 [bacterium endosymbiont of Mortierella elongata FMR23-6]GLR00857.1 hypothetical protein GCM10007934_06690 [Mycoavidus cysteinexigens]